MGRGCIRHCGPVGLHAASLENTQTTRSSKKMVYMSGNSIDRSSDATTLSAIISLRPEDDLHDSANGTGTVHQERQPLGTRLAASDAQTGQCCVVCTTCLTECHSVLGLPTRGGSLSLSFSHGSSSLQRLANPTIGWLRARSLSSNISVVLLNI